MRRRLVPALTGLLLASAVLAGCGDDAEPEDSAPAPQEVTEAAEITQTWPTTGLTVDPDDSADQRRPVLVVKMDNTASSAPQQGLDQADLVVEELVEGGMTRLAVFYYSRLPEAAGPVRSMRATDIGIVRPIDATMVTSGGAAVTLNRIADAGIEYVGEGGPGVYRESSRRAPYNVMADLTETASGLAQGSATRPRDYLSWGTSADLPSGQPARRIQVRFSGGHASDWRFARGGYVNTNSYADERAPFPADTVLVLRVRVGDAGYKDPAGNPVPETELTGTGEAMLFHGGRLVRGTWAKDSAEAPIRLSTVAGDLTVPAGRTWIELVPIDGGAVTVGKR